MARFVLGAPLTLLLASVAFAQNFVANAPLLALSFATHLVAALPGRNAISDVTLTRRATWIDWSDNDTRTTTVVALGTGESRINPVLTSGSRTEIETLMAAAVQHVQSSVY
jgi:DNA primase